MAKHIVWTEQARADVRAIEQPIALQILKTLARYAQTGEGNTKQLRDVEPPLLRLRARDHRVSSATKGTTWKSLACSIARKPIADVSPARAAPFERALNRSPSVRQFVRHILGRITGGANRNHNVLLAVKHIGHR